MATVTSRADEALSSGGGVRGADDADEVLGSTSVLAAPGADEHDGADGADGAGSARRAEWVSPPRRRPVPYASAPSSEPSGAGSHLS